MSSGTTFRRGDVANGEITPIPPRRDRPPKQWASLTADGDELVVRLRGWRSVLAVKRQLRLPLDSVVSVAHDPAVRSHVQAKLRRRASRTGVMRLGSYHSFAGWSLWAIGLGRNAVLVECSGTRYRYVVVEVADPAATVKLVRDAARLPGSPGAATREPGAVT